MSGKFVVRIDPELHRKLAVASETEGKSLYAWVTAALEREVSKIL